MGSLINRERQAALADWTLWNWIRMVVRMLATFIVTLAAFYLISQEISAAQAGLLFTFLSRVTGDLFGAMEQYSELDQTFVSAERVNQYVETAPVERKAGIYPDDSWPSQGRIAFKNISARYSQDLPDVLHDVSFQIEPGQRVGIVGSTGSGKSTLALTLFRAMELREGTIEIDGIDIHDVKLSELRKRLNMVVQDGSLGCGRLRDALDITGTKGQFR